ncbi:peroxiredoxin [Paracandidimonas lactea]|uniref:peroxiredoxin n=1 Tax=Paracandidimonas lactea TaxID=2895524 RepID=UPI001F1D75B5|nr:peroxiredoxin [Paracandidimonas lactea]
MRRSLIGLSAAFAAAAVISAVWTPAAHAALAVGAPAPHFALQIALAGETFDFSMKQALQKGPVVLYFYPAAFTKGCTIEAHTFAEAIDDYKALGATVIGISADDIDTLKAFSLGPCGSKFAVGADTSGKVIRAYDAALGTRPGRATRMSYVISPTGEVIYEYTAMEPDYHVKNTLEALRTWHERQPR